MATDYNQLAPEYAQHRQIASGVLERLVTTGAIGATAQVLEVGCGTGNYIGALEALTGCSCWGIDPSEQMLTTAQERSNNVHFQLGQAESIDLSDGMFDLAFSVDVIHHVGGRAAYFGEAYRVLKKNGLICTVTDSKQVIRQRQPLSNYFPETVGVDLGRYPRIAQLAELMEQEGFHTIEEKTLRAKSSLTNIDAYRDKAFSCLHLISKEAFEQGVQRMERDLQDGPIECIFGYTLLWGVK